MVGKGILLRLVVVVSSFIRFRQYLMIVARVVAQRLTLAIALNDIRRLPHTLAIGNSPRI